MNVGMLETPEIIHPRGMEERQEMSVTIAITASPETLVMEELGKLKEQRGDEELTYSVTKVVTYHQDLVPLSVIEILLIENPEAGDQTNGTLMGHMGIQNQLTRQSQ